MKKKPNGRTRSFFIRNDLDERITTIAKEKDRSRSYIIHKLLEQAVEHMELYPITIESRPMKGGRK